MRLAVYLERMRLKLCKHSEVLNTWNAFVGEILIGLGWYTWVLNLGHKLDPWKDRWWAITLYDMVLCFEILLLIGFPVTIPVVLVLSVMAWARIEVRRAVLRKEIEAELAAKDLAFVKEMEKGTNRSEWE